MKPVLWVVMLLLLGELFLMLIKFVMPAVPSSWGSVTLPEPESEGTISFCRKCLFTTCSVMQQHHPKRLLLSAVAL